MGETQEPIEEKETTGKNSLTPTIDEQQGKTNQTVPKTENLSVNEAFVQLAQKGFQRNSNPEPQVTIQQLEEQSKEDRVLSPAYVESYKSELRDLKRSLEKIYPSDIDNIHFGPNYTITTSNGEILTVATLYHEFTNYSHEQTRRYFLIAYNQNHDIVGDRRTDLDIRNAGTPTMYGFAYGRIETLVRGAGYARPIELVHADLLQREADRMQCNVKWTINDQNSDYLQLDSLRRSYAETKDPLIYEKLQKAEEEHHRWESIYYPLADRETSPTTDTASSIDNTETLPETPNTPPDMKNTNQSYNADNELNDTTDTTSSIDDTETLPETPNTPPDMKNTNQSYIDVHDYYGEDNMYDDDVYDDDMYEGDKFDVNFSPKKEYEDLETISDVHLIRKPDQRFADIISENKVDLDKKEELRDKRKEEFTELLKNLNNLTTAST